MERKLVTVVFADLVGSTALADEQDPERTRALLDRFYDEMAAEINAAGGTVEKFAGDAVMAAFGAPTAHEDDAERALHAALAMQRRLGDVDDRLSLRIGVNTGEVVVGRPREGSSFVTGDAVNVAARLEQAAEPGQILVGKRTVAAVRGAFEFDEPATVEAKGKPAGVPARRLVRALSLMRPRGVSGVAPVFVGRDAQLVQLRAAYRLTVEAAAPRLVTILGDAGVGKTRLARELWRALDAETPQPVRRTGRCLSYGEAATYWPLGEVLREHFGILENDDPETILERLAGREMLGITLSLDVAGDLHPLAVRDRFQDAWADFLTSLAAERPLVLLIEDAHWAEDHLLELLEQLLRDVRGPVLLIVTARPELTDQRPGWRTRSTDVIELDRLTAADSVRMIDELLAARVPERIRSLIVERAEGNPFFVEELLAMLIDRGVLERRNGSWTLHEVPDDVAVPDSVQAVLAARIDFLGPAEKTALQAAAVIGRVFWAGPVYELVEEEPNLRTLEERDFIFRRSASTLAGDREYAIKHALTREVAYASLPKAKRARLHASFADWLARTGRDEHAPLLAHHYAEAVRLEDADLAWAGEDREPERLRGEALHWLRRAGTLAIGRYEIEEGIELLKRALELEPSEREQSELWREIGRAHALKFDGEPFWTAMETSLEVCFDRMTCADAYAELALQTSARSGMWRNRPADELVEGWIERALELSEPDSAARAKGLIASSFWNRTDAMATVAEASAIAERLGSIELRSMAWSARSLAALWADDYDDAIVWAQRAFDLVDEIPDPDLRADVYWSPILPCVGRGRFREARRLAAGHDEINAKLTPHHRVHGVAVLLEVEELVGSWDRVRALEERTREVVEANLDTPCVRNARALLLCAIARLNEGDNEAAMRLEERADEIALQGYGLTLDAPRARLALLRGDLERVEGLLRPTAPSARGAGGGTFHLESESTLLDGLAAIGDRERVDARARPHLKPKTYLEPFAQRALGVVHQDDELIRQAVARFEELQLHWHAQQTPRLLELQA